MQHSVISSLKKNIFKSYSIVVLLPAVSKAASQETIGSGDRLVVCAGCALLYSLRFGCARTLFFLFFLPRAVHSAGSGVIGVGVVL